MAIDSFLNAADSARVARTFLNLARHDISRWALTGGVAYTSSTSEGDQSFGVCMTSIL
jgi:hypothetical protein